MKITPITEFSPKKQFALAEWKVVCATTGRIRLRVPQLAQNPEYAHRLEYLLSSYDFVTDFSVNSRAKSVAVNYQATTITSDRVHTWLLSLIQKAGREETQPPYPVTVARSNEPLSWRVSSSILESAKFAWEGLRYTFQTQRSFRNGIFAGGAAIALSLFLELNAVELAIVSIAVGTALALELVNTALEALVDLTVHNTYHPQAKIAKDCAAAAALISALAAMLVADFLLLPPLVDVTIA